MTLDPRQGQGVFVTTTESPAPSMSAPAPLQRVLCGATSGWQRVSRAEPDPPTAAERRRVLAWFASHRFGFHPGRGTMQVRRYLHPAYHVYVDRLCWTGMRPSEASGLEWAVQHEDVEFETPSETLGVVRERLSRSVAAGRRGRPPPPRCSRANELLDAGVVRIGDVDVPARVGRHAPGTEELSVARAEPPPRGEEGTARIELLDAVVAPIGDVDVPAPVGRHAKGQVELSVVAPRV